MRINVPGHRWRLRGVATHHPSVRGEPRIFQHVQKIRGCSRQPPFYVAPDAQRAANMALTACLRGAYTWSHVATTFPPCTTHGARVYVAPAPLLGYPRGCGNAVQGVYTRCVGLAASVPLSHQQQQVIRARMSSMLSMLNLQGSTSWCGRC